MTRNRRTRQTFPNFEQVHYYHQLTQQTVRGGLPEGWAFQPTKIGAHTFLVPMIHTVAEEEGQDLGDPDHRAALAALGADNRSLLLDSYVIRYRNLALLRYRRRRTNVFAGLDPSDRMVEVAATPGVSAMPQELLDFDAARDWGLGKAIARRVMQSDWVELRLGGWHVPTIIGRVNDHLPLTACQLVVEDGFVMMEYQVPWMARSPSLTGSLSGSGSRRPYGPLVDGVTFCLGWHVLLPGYSALTCERFQEAGKIELAAFVPAVGRMTPFSRDRVTSLAQQMADNARLKPLIERVVQRARDEGALLEWEEAQALAAGTQQVCDLCWATPTSPQHSSVPVDARHDLLYGSGIWSREHVLRHIEAGELPTQLLKAACRMVPSVLIPGNGKAAGLEIAPHNRLRVWLRDLLYVGPSTSPRQRPDRQWGR